MAMLEGSVASMKAMLETSTGGRVIHKYGRVNVVAPHRTSSRGQLKSARWGSLLRFRVRPGETEKLGLASALQLVRILPVSDCEEAQAALGQLPGTSRAGLAE